MTKYNTTESARPIDRLLSLINSENLSIRGFESSIKVANGYIKKQQNGKGGIGTDVLEKTLLAYPDWDLYWIVTGQGSPQIEKSIVREDDVKYIPFYDTEAAAGSEVAVDTEAITTPTNMIDVGDLLRDSECAIRIYGNSMTPNYPSGCVVGLKEVQDGIVDYGNVYVVETVDNRYLKRLYSDDDGRGYMCFSDNHMKYEEGMRKGKYYYEPFLMPFDTIRKLYRVTGVIKRNINSVIAGG